MSTDRTPGAERSAPGHPGHSSGRRRSPTEDGMVTAETAVVVPSLLILGLVLVWAVTVGTAQMRCFDAARAGARALARGESIDAVRQMAEQAAPAGAIVTVVRRGEDVEVQVAFTAGGPGWMPALPDLRVTGSAVAASEDDAGEGGER